MRSGDASGTPARYLAIGIETLTAVVAGATLVRAVAGPFRLELLGLSLSVRFVKLPKRSASEISWQITPRTLTNAMAAERVEAKHAVAATMEMNKIDVATIEAEPPG